MAKSIFQEIEEKYPVDQIISDSMKNLQQGSPDQIAERLDKLIVLMGRLAFQPDNAQLLPKVYNIDITKTNTDVSLGMKNRANSITFYKPEIDLTIKMAVIISGAEVIMTEYKKIPSGRDTKIDGITISEIYYSNAPVVGGTPVEVLAVWI
ncbi:hypothetical protein [Candidatus Methanoperedens nitratireducens]|uniref:Uncharacterized protein n=1 Tax=Candidatus Methanoperedens nitratireducens TaxID=1392998 RepID=A0A284VJV9_9EURY|nr:hypothetical protein [Candidatus Methanoperedens nitroreducens]SNQ59545.1 hypothetical protein MNV_1210028 [Candidatus Methanoperedens nitroreducens]